MPAAPRALFGLDGGQPPAAPAFGSLADEDYRWAIEQGMVEQRARLDDLVGRTAPPTTDLLRDWERSSHLLDRARSAFLTLLSADATPAREAIEADLAPALARHRDAIWLDRALYERFRDLETRAAGLDDQDAWLLSEILRRFRRAGIDLPEAHQQELRDLNERIAALEAEFSARVVAGRRTGAVLITDRAGLDGLGPDQIEAARRAAERHGWDGFFALDLVNTTGQPLLSRLNNRDTRQLLYEASVGRGRVAESDTRPVIVELARLRARKAALLGFPHYAAYVADDCCAKTTEAVMGLLTRAAAAAGRAVRREADALRARFAALVPGETLQAWDWQWTAAQRPADAPGVDEETLSAYLPFEQVLEQGVLAAAGILYGLTFTRRDTLGGYTADCRAYEVHEADGTLLGGVIFDPYARPTKGGGAWMTLLVPQSRLFGDLPVVTNNGNLTRPEPNRPCLMTWKQVTTLFHEFGHDLHGLLSDVRYPSVSGTRTPTDFVEFPSQVNEIWAWEPALIARFARHYETGEPLPDHLIDALVESRQAGEGYIVFEKYAAMLLDQAWHQTPPDELPSSPDEVDAFEQAALERAGVWFPLVPPRYRSCYFMHIWGHGYAAAYYAYLWSEVLDADTDAWFAGHGGLDRDAGEAFRRGVLAVGGSRDVMAAYRDFRGSDPDPAHLMRREGLE